jgi:predicted Zn-dependent protease
MWRQLIEERMASARERDKQYKDDSRSVYSTHPPTGDRMENLAETAAFLERQNGSDQASNRREEWRRAILPHFTPLLEEQVRLNDPGASLYLIERRARDGWTGVLYYYQGEVYRLRNNPGDGVLAAQSYAAAVALPDAPPEAWRANGYALLKAGRRDEGKQSLSRYLELQPAAKDAAMVRFSLTQ